jgi:hypothetical protein
MTQTNADALNLDIQTRTAITSQKSNNHTMKIVLNTLNSMNTHEGKLTLTHEGPVLVTTIQDVDLAGGVAIMQDVTQNLTSITGYNRMDTEPQGLLVTMRGNADMLDQAQNKLSNMGVSAQQNEDTKSLQLDLAEKSPLKVLQSLQNILN